MFVSTLLLALIIAASAQEVADTRVCGIYKSHEESTSYYTLQIFSAGDEVTALKLKSWQYMDTQKQNFMQGFVYYIEPDTGFVNDNTHIAGTATITKVYGVFGNLFKSSITCNNDWTVMSELDITTYECTLGGSDAFASIRKNLGKKVEIDIKKTATGIEYDGVVYEDRMSEEGCMEALPTEAPTAEKKEGEENNMMFIIVIVVVVVLVILIIVIIVILIQKKKKNGSKTLPKKESAPAVVAP